MRTAQYVTGTQHNSKPTRGVNVAMVTQQTHRDSHKHSGNQLNSWVESSSCQFTETQASMHCNHGHGPASLCPPMKGRLWGLFLEGLKSCSPALWRQRKWLPTDRHCWQHHTHFSLLHTLSNHPAFNLRHPHFPSEFYAVSCRPSLAFTFSVMNAPVSSTWVSPSFVMTMEITTSLLV